MKSTARRPDRQGAVVSLLGVAMTSAGTTIARNPLAVGGTTAFLVSFAFVSANALWYQPHFHESAFIATRAPAEINRSVQVAPTPAPRREEAVYQEREAKPDTATTGAVPSRPTVTPVGDATVLGVQQVLEDLGLYRGSVDGLTGPQTRAAIENYRRIVGLEPSGGIDPALLEQLGLESKLQRREEVPAPTPRPRASATAGMPMPVQEQTQVQTVAYTEADPTIMRVQSGLKAFGNDGIEADGLLGDNTRAAIREFQSLFGLPVTGEPDAAFVAKMREVGLMN